MNNEIVGVKDFSEEMDGKINAGRIWGYGTCKHTCKGRKEAVRCNSKYRVRGQWWTKISLVYGEDMGMQFPDTCVPL